MARFDSHERARRALAKKVVARYHDWHLLGGRELAWVRELGWEVYESILMVAALAAISGHRWRNGWGEKLSPYAPFGPRQKPIGTFRDVPKDEIHKIMCDMDVRPIVERAWRLERAARKAIADRA